MSAVRAVVVVGLWAACVTEGVQRPDFDPCASPVECRSGRCALAAPGGGYCLPEGLEAEASGLAYLDGVCPAGLHCVWPGARAVCALAPEVACEAGYQRCVGGCVRLDVDPGHCGACETPCPEGAWCQEGACRCPPGQPLACGGRCVDPATDLDHCGGCEAPCAPAHATGMCALGRCEVVACDPDWVQCRGQSGCDTAALDAVMAGITVEPERWHPDYPVLTVEAGTAVHLSAEAGGDPRGGPPQDRVASWEWQLIGRPQGNGPRLWAQADQATLHTPLVGVYEVRLDGTTVEGSPICRPAEVLLWAWGDIFDRRFEVTWDGPGDLDVHVRWTGGTDPDWFGLDDCWVGHHGSFGAYTCQPFHTPDAEGHEVLGLQGFRDTADIAIHRGLDGEGGVAQASFRFYGRRPWAFPLHSTLYFAGPVALREGQLWRVGQLRPPPHPFAPAANAQGEPVVLEYGPAPVP